MKKPALSNDTAGNFFFFSFTEPDLLNLATAEYMFR